MPLYFLSLRKSINLTLTASIVLHRTPYPQLMKALECLLRSDVSKVYLIDNSPTDALRQAETIDRRVVYRHVENRGFGAGHNLAIREIRDGNDYHLVMNADVCWDGDIIATLLEYMYRHADVGIIAPKVFYPDADLQYSCRMLPTPVDLFAKRFLPGKLVKRRMDRYLLAHHDHDKELNCPYLLGSFLLFRVEALRDCGIFDERFFMYPEDIDITRRIHEKWKTIYYPSVSIVHEHAAASRKSMKMLWIHLSNMVKYFNKWGWIIDKKRSGFNKTLLNKISYIPQSRRPQGRG